MFACGDEASVPAETPTDIPAETPAAVDVSIDMAEATQIGDVDAISDDVYKLNVSADNPAGFSLPAADMRSSAATGALTLEMKLESFTAPVAASTKAATDIVKWYVKVESASNEDVSDTIMIDAPVLNSWQTVSVFYSDLSAVALNDLGDMTIYPESGSASVLVAKLNMAVKALHPQITVAVAPVSKSDEQILGNPDYPAISYGAWRTTTREAGENVPTVEQQKEDMKILAAMGIKVIRTYNTQGYMGLDDKSNTENLLEAIKQLMAEDDSFEMYVMLGVWIDALNSWTNLEVIHDQENPANADEIAAAKRLALAYPEIVKVIAVGNEAMVDWAPYHVVPKIILDHVNDLQAWKKLDPKTENIWITSSDNFAVWSGNDKNGNTGKQADLNALIKAVDYISLHTYPFHDTHYASEFWQVSAESAALTEKGKIDAAMEAAEERAIEQFTAGQAYMLSKGINKPVHIGETGWANISNGFYGEGGSQAADEYKQKAFYDAMRKWSDEFRASLFFFEAFDEPWKGAGAKNSGDSEQHFGLIDIDCKVKHLAWDKVDTLNDLGLTRDCDAGFTKSFDGDVDVMLDDVFVPPSAPVIEVPEGDKFTVLDSELRTGLKTNAWEGTAGIELADGVINVTTAAAGAEWWGAGVEGGNTDLTEFKGGNLVFDIKGDTTSSFKIGFQTGTWAGGDQVNNFVTFASGSARAITADWVTHTIPLSELDEGANWTEVTAPFAVMGDTDFDGLTIQIKNISFQK